MIRDAAVRRDHHAHTRIYTYSPGRSSSSSSSTPANVSGKLNDFLLLFSGVPGRAQVERVGWRRAPGVWPRESVRRRQTKKDLRGGTSGSR
jgi:hypothetical protein